MVFHENSKGHLPSHWMTPLPNLRLLEAVKTHNKQNLGLSTKLPIDHWPQTQSLLNAFAERPKNIYFLLQQRNTRPSHSKVVGSWKWVPPLGNIGQLQPWTSLPVPSTLGLSGYRCTWCRHFSSALLLLFFSVCFVLFGLFVVVVFLWKLWKLSVVCKIPYLKSKPASSFVDRFMFGSSTTFR